MQWSRKQENRRETTVEWSNRWPIEDEDPISCESIRSSQSVESISRVSISVDLTRTWNDGGGSDAAGGRDLVVAEAELLEEGARRVETRQLAAGAHHRRPRRRRSRRRSRRRRRRRRRRRTADARRRHLFRPVPRNSFPQTGETARCETILDWTRLSERVLTHPPPAKKTTSNCVEGQNENAGSNRWNHATPDRGRVNSRSN